MNYELAKSLKDAGFPQDKWSQRWCVEVLSGDSFEHMKTHPESHGVFNDEQIAKNKALVPMCVAPTLSELIEACERLTFTFGLEKHTNDWRSGVLKTGGVHNHVSGSTPEEAVTMLWLQLQKHGTISSNARSISTNPSDEKSTKRSGEVA